jgi:hypothetical protein
MECSKPDGLAEMMDGSAEAAKQSSRGAISLDLMLTKRSHHIKKLHEL